MKREEDPWQQLLPLAAEDPAREYIDLRRSWSILDFFNDKSWQLRTLLVLSFVATVGFFAATAVGASGGYA
jgi:hypothetical protein